MSAELGGAYFLSSAFVSLLELGYHLGTNLHQSLIEHEHLQRHQIRLHLNALIVAEIDGRLTEELRIAVFHVIARSPLSDVARGYAF